MPFSLGQFQVIVYRRRTLVARSVGELPCQFPQVFAALGYLSLGHFGDQ
jgi:hypothetical protein